MIELRITAAVFGIGVLISFLATNVSHQLVSEPLAGLIA